jgi:gas vesicle protein
MTAGKVLFGVLTCVTVGAALGILYAPQKGYKTRKMISKKGNGYTKKLEGKFNGLIENINEEIESVKEDVTRLTKLGKDKAEEEDAKLNNAAN